MRTVAGWALALLAGLAILAGLIAILNARDQSEVARSGGPGTPYRGRPALSPALANAVKRGNVVVLYRDARPPAGTRALVPPGGRALEEAGQSVLIEREPSLTTPLAAVSATRIQPAEAPNQLRPFIDYWLGGP